MSPRAEPADSDRIPSANERLKRSFSSVFWGAMIAATVVHYGLFALWPELRADDITVTNSDVVSVNLPPDVVIPPAPKAIARPAVPVMATTAVNEDVTIAPTTFEQNQVENLPPPPQQNTEVDITKAPVFTPYTVAPAILNKDAVIREMERAYPPVLRDAGIGGTVVVYFLIDEKGVVKDRRVWKSSGYPPLDAAAIEVADVYRFSAALNRDKKVPVWVQFPITFTVAGARGSGS